MPINDFFSKALKDNITKYQQDSKPADIDAYNTFNTDRNILTPIDIINKKKLLAPEKISDEYKEAGIIPSVYDTEEDYRKRYNEHLKEEQRLKAEEQSAWDKWGNFFVQIAGSEIALGTIKGVVDIGDAVINLVSGNGLGDFSNPISEALEKTQENIRNEFPIYERDPESTFNFGDLGWYLNRGTSVASTITLMIPSMGAGKVASLASKTLRGAGIAAKYSKANKVLGIAPKAKLTTSAASTVNNLNRAAKASAAARAEKSLSANFMRGYKLHNNAARAMDEGFNIVGASLASRIAEGYMEARDTWKQSYDIALQELQKPENAYYKEELIKKHKELEGLNDNQIAEVLADRAAKKTFNQDMLLIAFDMLQFRALNKIITGGVKGINQVNTVNTRLANRNMLKRMAGKSGADLEQMGFWARQVDKLANPSFKFLAAAGEIPEEIFQGVSNEMGKETVYKSLFPYYQEKTLNSYLSDPHIWEQGFWGFIGGSVFNAIGSGINKIKTYKKAKESKDLTNKAYNDYLMTSEEKMALEKIEARQHHFESLLNNIAKDEELVDKNKEEGGIDEIEFNKRKETHINNFLTDVTLDAIDSGTYDLLKEFMTNPEFKDIMKQNGIELTFDESNFQNEIIKETDKIKDIYADEVSKILDAIDDINPYVAQLVARETTRKKIEINRLNKSINNIDSVISSSLQNEPNANTISQINDNYYKNQYYNKLLKVKNELEEQISELEKDELTHDGSQFISKQAKNEYIFELQKQLSEINNELDVNYSGFIQNTEMSLPNYGIAKKIDNKIDSQIQILKLKSELFTTPEDYQHEYEYFYNELSVETKKRFDEAYNNVYNWLKDQENIYEAYTDILNNNVKELEESLDILKLGYGSGRAYNTQLLLAIKEIKKEQLAKNNGNAFNENETPTVDIKQEAIEQNENKANQDAKTKTNFNTLKAQFNTLNKLLNKSNKPSNKEIANRLNNINKVFEQIDNDIKNGVLLTEEQLNNLNKYKEEYNKLKERFNVAKENVFIEKEQEKKQSNQHPFTGEFQEETPSNLDNTIYETSLDNEEINELERQIQEQEANALNNEEELIEGTAYNYIRNLFIRDKELFANIKNIDPNSEEFKNLIEIVKEDMIADTINGINIDDIILKDLKTFVIGLKNRIKRDPKHADIKEQLDNIIDILSSGIKLNFSNNRFTNADLIDDNNIEEVLNDFFNKFVEVFKIKNKTNDKYDIDLSLVFEYLFNSNKHSYEKVINIYNLLKNNIDKIQNFNFINSDIFEKYKNNNNAFINSLQLAKEKQEVEERYIHIEGSNYSDKTEIERVLSQIKPGDELTYETTPNSNSISIKYKGVEIGYIKKVVHDGTKTKFKLISNNLGSFNLEVSKNQNEEISSNLDDLFYSLIESSDPAMDKTISFRHTSGNDIKIKYSEILDALTLHKEKNKLIKDLQNDLAQGNINEKEFNKKLKEINIRINNAEFILKNLYDILSQGGLLNNNIFNVFKTATGINYQKTNEALVNSIDKILNYDTKDRLISYINFLEKQYKNYTQTYTLQENIENGNKTLKFGGSEAVLNYESDPSKSLTPINDNKFNFTHQNNHLLILNNGRFFDEVTGEYYGNKPGFKEGTFALMLTKNPDAPMVAILKTAKLNSSPKMKEAVKIEINKLLSDYQNSEVSYDEIYRRLVHLFGAKKGESHKNSLFNGVNVFKSNDHITVYKEINNGIQPIFSIHRYKAKSSDPSTGISFYEGKKISSTFKKNDKFLNKIANSVIDELTFNRTYYSIKNRGTDESVNRSPYFYRENNKIKINIGNFNQVYDSYTQFIFDVGAFTTNHNSLQYDTSKGFYAEVSKVSTPSPVKGIISEPTETDTKINTRSLLGEITNDFTIYDELSGNTETTKGIDLIPEEIIYTTEENKGYAYFDPKTKKIVLTKKGINSINKSYNKSASIIRLLMHEQLHKKIDAHKLFKRKELVNELLETYDRFLKYIENDNSKEANDIKEKFLKNSHFSSVQDYISNLTGKEVKELTDDDYRRFAEEWLVETLSQKALLNYLNTIPYDNVVIAELKEEEKTIWQKIIDILLKIFGLSSKNIKNNTILAKHYELLGNKYGTEFADDVVQPVSETKIEETKTETESVKEEKTETKVEETEEQSYFEKAKKQKRKRNIDENLVNTELIEDNTYQANTQDIDDNYSITNMRSYIRQFPTSERLFIAREINGGTISFACK